MTITNLGPSESARFYSVVDTLPAALTLINFSNADTGQPLDCSLEGKSEVCPVGDMLAVGDGHAAHRPGEFRTQAFDVVNLGPSTTRAPAVLTIEVPTYLHGTQDELPTECAQDPKGTRITCEIPAGLKPGGTRPRGLVNGGLVYTTGPLRFPVDPLAPGGARTTGTVTVAYTGPNGPAQTTGTWTTDILPPQAGLTVTKNAVPPTNGRPVTVSNPFDYVITVANRGPSAARNVFVTDPLPKALVFARSPTGCRASGQMVTCPVHDPLLPGASVTERIAVKLSQSYRGNGTDIFNTATAHSDTPTRCRARTLMAPAAWTGSRSRSKGGTMPPTGTGDLASALGWAAALTGAGAVMFGAVRRRRRPRLG
ncbi:DUF11 domain-containing protein [Streptacidiphilus albus]|uniref:DUF11 domain-containing protein n=1 Tax=Streptacidiphilus albus TaxID=105425 RepID=UPI00054BE3C1|nr:DUF11 domain-containing protein [Streptacidiphilus albus]